MTTHMWINKRRFAEQQEKITQVDGVDIRVQLSSFDFPQAVKGTFERDSGLFRIDFEYADSEPAASKVSKVHGLFITEGRHSGKLLSIRIPVVENNVTVIAVTTQLKSAFASRRRNFSGMKTISKELNQNVAEAILNEEGIKTLSADLVCAS